MSYSPQLRIHDDTCTQAFHNTEFSTRPFLTPALIPTRLPLLPESSRNRSSASHFPRKSRSNFIHRGKSGWNVLAKPTEEGAAGGCKELDRKQIEMRAENAGGRIPTNNEKLSRLGSTVGNEIPRALRTSPTRVLDSQTPVSRNR